jgi:hypothetical protein
MKHVFVIAYAAALALSACGRDVSTQLPHAQRSPSILNIVADPWVSLDSTNEYRLSFTDGRELALTKTARMRSDGKYVSFRGHGYQVSYPVSSVSSLTAIRNGARQPLYVIQPVCVDPSGTCCDPFIGCYSNPPDGPVIDPANTFTINFSLYGGVETCDWSWTTDWISCNVGGFPSPNTGDGYKGNVVKSFTWSVSLQDAEIACNPASYTSNTKGTMEYTETRPGQLPAFSVRATGPLGPNTEVHMHFHPALSAASQAAGIFLFVYPSIGLAAICSQAPAVTIP